MARTNLFALTGAVLSIVSVGLLWIPAFFAGLPFSSADTDLIETVRGYSMTVSAIFIAGAILALGTQLALALEIPGLIVMPFWIWYHGDYSFRVLGGYGFALLGAILLAHSFLVQMTVPGWRIRIPPESRIRVWLFWKEERNPMKIPKNVARVAAVLIIVSTVAFSAVLASAYVNPASKIKLLVVIDSDTYGDVSLSIVLDHDTVATTQVDADPVNRTAYYNLLIECTAGSHHFSVDAMSDTYLDTNNRLDYYSTAKVLPFTTEIIEVGIGVGFV